MPLAYAVAALGGAPVGPVRDPAILGAVVELVRTGALDPKVTRVIPFERAAEAVRAVEGGHGRGETVLEMPPLTGEPERRTARPARK
ncbi:zinc-binding dehydrogenase [Streptomyces sp. NPDC058459]|uniref:zinc-binding dehydrogenase n=1 Tax=Streptomyces sp. NPDC058459 TaxID=3346508 RepID=UPI003666AB1A